MKIGALTILVAAAASLPCQTIVSFSGSGVNDAEGGGIAGATAAGHRYAATVCTRGTPDRIRTRKDDGPATVCVPVTGGKQPLYYPAGNVSDATWVAGRATFVTTTPHGLATNALATVRTVRPSGYNLTLCPVVVTGPSRFSCALPDNPGRYISGGTALGADGLDVSYATTSGHRTGDTWNFRAAPGPVRDGNPRAGTRRTVSVTDFGNGDHDGSAFQAAINYCASLTPKCRVLIPSGAYSIATGITLDTPAYKGINIAGEGIRTTRIVYTGSGCLFSAGHGTALNRFSGFSVEGTQSASAAFCFSDANIASEVDHVEMDGFPNGTGIVVGSTSALGEQIRVNRCNFGSLKTGVSVTGAAVSVENSDFSGGTIGISILTGYRTSVRNNTFQAMKGFPIEVVRGGASLSITENYFEANAANNIEIARGPVSAVTISENYFRSGGSHYDVFLGNCSDCTLNTNTFSGNVSAPARVYVAGGSETKHLFSSSSADLDTVPVFNIARRLESGMVEETFSGKWVRGAQDETSGGIASASALPNPRPLPTGVNAGTPGDSPPAGRTAVDTTRRTRAIAGRPAKTTGFSGTKTVGRCVFTITNGLITNVSGC